MLDRWSLEKEDGMIERWYRTNRYVKPGRGQERLPRAAKEAGRHKRISQMKDEKYAGNMAKKVKPTKPRVDKPNANPARYQAQLPVMVSSSFLFLTCLSSFDAPPSHAMSQLDSTARDSQEEGGGSNRIGTLWTWK